VISIPKLLASLGIDARQRGGEWSASCPLPDHDDRSPSWSIHEGGEIHGSWYCFGCDRGGGPVELVAEVIDITEGSAREWVDERCTVEDEAPPRRVEVIAHLSGTFRLPDGVVRAPLAKWVTPARRYVQSRGITDEQIERWGIGYAVDGRLGGRVVFPIADERGILRSYTARTFIDSDLRYLTPKTGEGANADAIFGAQHWRLRRNVVAVTEGAIDALACERAGVECVAALGGSRRSPDQFLALSGFKRVLVATDSDDAGERIAAELTAALSRWGEVRRVRIPSGEDAASMSRDALEAALGSA
jgi:DNA primase